MAHIKRYKITRLLRKVLGVYHKDLITVVSVVHVVYKN